MPPYSDGQLGLHCDVQW